MTLFVIYIVGGIIYYTIVSSLRKARVMDEDLCFIAVVWGFAWPVAVAAFVIVLLGYYVIDKASTWLNKIIK